ncbi:MAG: hypothetical protein E7263_11640 [Lachnospiraceae bacterium]|nr:hypothetical protein [Lachnospiraceae bacterium]
MKILDLLNYSFSDNEKYKADVANRLLNTFFTSVNFNVRSNYIRFYTEGSNDPNGNRVIYIENMGYTLLSGDGDRGHGWIVDGVTIWQNLNSRFDKRIMNLYNKIEDSEEIYEFGEIGFINDFEDFIDYMMKRVFSLEVSSEDVFNNSSVKRFLDYNMDIRNI